MLVEMVAAVSLTALLMTFVLPSAPIRTSTSRFLGIVTDATALLRDARSDAIAHGGSSSAQFDARARLLRTASRQVAIPVDVDIALTAGGNCASDGKSVAQIVFRADGTNCGGVLRFARGGRVIRVRVDWIDGRIDVVQGG